MASTSENWSAFRKSYWMKCFRAFFFLPSLDDLVAAHRFDTCWNGAETNCGSEGRAFAAEGAVVLLKGARKERACAIGAETNVVLSRDASKTLDRTSGVPRYQMTK